MSWCQRANKCIVLLSERCGGRFGGDVVNRCEMLNKMREAVQACICSASEMQKCDSEQRMTLFSNEMRVESNFELVNSKS